jgi:hypothetical protein
VRAAPAVETSQLYKNIAPTSLAWSPRKLGCHNSDTQPLLPVPGLVLARWLRIASAVWHCRNARFGATGLGGTASDTDFRLFSSQFSQSLLSTIVHSGVPFTSASLPRRKVFDGRSSHPLQAAHLLALIQQLYDVEDRGKTLSVAERLALRQRESVQLLNRIRLVMDSVECQLVLPKSIFAKALGYLRNHWTALLVYTTNGLLPIDNNDVEQLMKQVALGRNYAEFKIMRSC